MAKVLAALVAALALALAGVLGFYGYELHKLGIKEAQAQSDLRDAQAANQTQALALAKVLADRAEDAKQRAVVDAKLQAISAEQQTKHTVQIKVLEHATPTEKNLLGSKLPAATLQLFPRTAATSSADASRHAVHS